VSVQANTKYDAGARRQSKQGGREVGCWLYVPGEELRKAGIDPKGPPPLYRVWGTARGGIFARLYRNTEAEQAREVANG
jgi:hypothetical protein